MRNSKNIVSHTERWFFYIVVCAHVWPLLNVQFFPTLDGPAHVYNSRIIADFIFNSGGNFESVFELNPFPIPNLSGHVFMALLQGLFPAWVAEKIFQIAIIALIPFGFRFWLKSAGAKSLVASYFIFPVTYSFFFFYGFYNFCFSLAVLFFALGAMERYHGSSPKLWPPGLVFILGLILYFSHLLTFAVFCIYMAVRTMATFRKPGAAISQRRYAFLLFALSLFPGLLLTAIFLLNQDVAAGQLAFSPLADTANMYRVITPAKGILYGKEDKYTQWIFYSLVFMILSWVYHSIRSKYRIDQRAGIPGLLFAAFFILSFVLPDQGLLSGGILTSRIVLFAIVFLIAFLAMIPINRFAGMALLVVISYVNIACLLIYVDATESEQAIVSQISTAAGDLQSGAVVMPLNQSDFWIREHYSNYLGYQKPVVVLENYEADLDYFFLNWTENGVNAKRAAYADWEKFTVSGIPERQPNNSATHIFLLGNSDTELKGSQHIEHPNIEVVRADTALGVGLYKWLKN
ncbi:MAG: hypothetical protein LC664_07270 [Flavobacteriales bacterium]|nr:hypothetical protein [Flavobacteriales bacterium]